MAQRWLKADVFEAMVHDLRLSLHVLSGRKPAPSAAVYDSRVLRSTPESGERAGYNGDKKTKGSNVHIAVDTLGHLLALKVTPANEDDRTQVEVLSKELQEATGENVEIAYIASANERTQRRFLEFFAATIRNKNTRGLISRRV